jgi:photosystem II stability/assembly factor-like uncharacterized protein
MHGLTGSLSMSRWRSLLLGFLIISMPIGICEGQWQRTNGPTGGPVLLPIVYGNKMFCGSNAGVFSSADSGFSWKKANNGLTDLNVMSMISMEGCLFAATRSGLFRSIDGGENWNLLTSTVNKWTAYLVSGKEIFCLNGSEGVTKSSDSGSSWSSANRGLPTPAAIDDFINFEGMIFANRPPGYGGDSGVFRSSNQGASWRRVYGLKQNQFGDFHATIRTLAMKGQNLIAGTNIGLYRSSDSGQSWVKCDERFSDYVIAPFFESNGILFAGAYSSTDTFKLLHSSDSGITWQVDGVGGIGSQWMYPLLKFGNYQFSKTEMGLFRADTNGGSWALTSIPTAGSQVSSFAKRGNLLLAGTRTGVFSTSNKGGTWEQFGSGLDTTKISALVQNEKFVFAASMTGRNLFQPTLVSRRLIDFSWPNDGPLGGIYRISDSSSSWEAVNKGLTNRSVHCLAVDGPRLFAGTDSGIFRSTNDGESWEQVKLYSSVSYRSAIVSMSEIDGKLFAGSFGAIFRSIDQGASWQENLPGGGTQWFYSFTSLGGTLLALGSGGDALFISVDSGATWSSAPTTDLRLNYTSATIGSRIFIGGYKGFSALSSDSGKSWVNVNKGLPASSSVISLAEYDGDLFAGTFDQGVWMRPLPEMNGPDAIRSSHPRFPESGFNRNVGAMLHRGAKIQFSTGSDAFASLCVFNARGKKLATLVNSFLDKGEHRVSLEGAGLADGLLFLRLETKGSVFTKRILLGK